MTSKLALDDTLLDNPEPNSQAARDLMVPTSETLLKRMDSSDGTLLERVSTIDHRRRLRSEAQRHRIRRRLMTLALALVPVVVAGAYLIFLAVPQFQAEARFSVQAAQLAAAPMSTGSTMSSLLSQGNGAASAAAGFVDGWAVLDFINSRDCMQQLDQKIGLKKYLPKSPLELLTGTWERSSNDPFRAYLRMIHASYNMIEQINVVEVDGLSPSDSEAVANGLIAVVQDFVNRMNQEGIKDAIKVSREAVQQAEQQGKAANAEISQWRLEHGNIDPSAEAGMLLNQVSELETNLTAAEVNLAGIKAQGNPKHPMLAPAQQQVDALNSRLNDLRSRMSGKGDTLASQMKTYVELSNQQTFADSNLMQARQSYQQAFTNAMALQRYLSIIARPVSETQPSIPNVLIVLLLALGSGCCLAGGYNLIQALYRSFRYA
ncbi:hypothetical protein [Mesorhizobium abyssinicae]|uniref:hypothetical protein n=1 Tax=Mesorhizobium abyssinicae TaxID=1209958 RepID=UPI003399BF2C